MLRYFKLVSSNALDICAMKPKWQNSPNLVTLCLNLFFPGIETLFSLKYRLPHQWTTPTATCS